MDDVEYRFEANYRKLKNSWQGNNDGNFVIMPLIPYSPRENDYDENLDIDDQGQKTHHPLPPDWSRGHFLGTDKVARDVLSRMIYGFRSAIILALVVVFATMLIGFTVGMTMGYRGGLFDLTMLQVLPIYNAIPELVILMILASVIPITIPILIVLLILLRGTQGLGDARSMTYREKARDYVLAARSMGAGHKRVIFRHILPNIAVIVIVKIPFAINGAIAVLAALDYLGFGLSPDQPSLGNMLKEGQNLILDKPWILASVVAFLATFLVMVTFVGEALREAFDPKQHSYYE